MISKIRFNVSSDYYEEDAAESFRDGIRDFQRGIQGFTKYLGDEIEDDYDGDGCGHKTYKLNKEFTNTDLESLLKPLMLKMNELGTYDISLEDDMLVLSASMSMESCDEETGEED